MIEFFQTHTAKKTTIIMNQEQGPTPEILSDDEVRVLEREARQERVAQIDRDPEKLSDQLFFTPAERLMIGSTEPGLGFFLNSPMAVEANVDLEIINQKRSRVADRLKKFLLRLDGESVYLHVELLPLTPEMLSSEKPIITFEVLSVERVFPDRENNEVSLSISQDRLKEEIINRISLEQGKVRGYLARGGTYSYPDGMRA